MIVKPLSRVTFLSRALREDVLQLRATKTGEALMSIRRRARTLLMMSTYDSRALSMSEYSQTPDRQSPHLSSRSSATRESRGPRATRTSMHQDKYPPLSGARFKGIVRGPSIDKIPIS
jgi:hypothetical protein